MGIGQMWFAEAVELWEDEDFGTRANVCLLKPPCIMVSIYTVDFLWAVCSPGSLQRD